MSIASILDSQVKDMVGKLENIVAFVVTFLFLILLKSWEQLAVSSEITTYVQSMVQFSHVQKTEKFLHFSSNFAISVIDFLLLYSIF